MLNHLLDKANVHNENEGEDQDEVVEVAAPGNLGVNPNHPILLLNEEDNNLDEASAHINGMSDDEASASIAGMPDDDRQDDNDGQDNQSYHGDDNNANDNNNDAGGDEHVGKPKEESVS